MVTTIMDASNQVCPQLTAYRYDQLNRITKMKTFAGSSTSNIWTGSLADNYAETYRYDANGNIVQLNRYNASGISLFDNLVYNYNGVVTDPNPTKWTLTNNRLAGVLQNASPVTNQFKTTTYDYDDIGNLTHDANENIDIVEWNVYGKIKKIIRTKDNSVNLNTTSLEFIYDAMGNRICKIEKLINILDNSESRDYNDNLNNANWIYHFYTRDAQGNIMATYKTENSQTTLTEFDLYGSNRIGIKALDLLMQEPAPNLNPTYSRIMGDKRYEISNHLGNVVTIFSDRKIAKDDENNDGIIDNYKTYLFSSQDYTPFGMAMNGRGKNQVSGDYRFGFNGKEKDNEVKGIGNQQDYGMRIYDPRIGRFLSVDPLFKKFPELTTYQFASNSPIWAIDLDGLEARVYTETKGYTGHTFVTVGSGRQTIVYTYGRYAELGKNKPSLTGTTPTGQGVLIRLTKDDARKYVANQIHDNGAKAFEIKNADENKVKGYFENLFNSSSQIPQKGDYAHNTKARVIDEYKVLDNNCTTKSIEGVQKGAADFNPTNTVGTSDGTKEAKIWIPAVLQNYLENKSEQPNSNVKEVTPEVKKELNIPNGGGGTW